MKVVRSSEVPWSDRLMRGAYASRRKELGGEKVACGLWELAPGKKSFPMHVHHVTEEALFVVSGKAKVRTPEGETPLSTGDFVSFPAGGPAHQLINDTHEPFVYLALSANAAGVDIVDYPESGKVAGAVGKFPTGRRFIFRARDEVDYFTDDQDAE